MSYYYLSEKMDVATAEGVEIEGIKSFVTFLIHRLLWPHSLDHLNLTSYGVEQDSKAIPVTVGEFV